MVLADPGLAVAELVGENDALGVLVEAESAVLLGGVQRHHEHAEVHGGISFTGSCVPARVRAGSTKIPKSATLSTWARKFI